jgi:hypothetical protein
MGFVGFSDAALLVFWLFPPLYRLLGFLLPHSFGHDVLL